MSTTLTTPNATRTIYQVDQKLQGRRLELVPGTAGDGLPEAVVRLA